MIWKWKKERIVFYWGVYEQDAHRMSRATVTLFCDFSLFSCDLSRLTGQFKYNDVVLEFQQSLPITFPIIME